MSQSPPRVFISYRQESEELGAWVLRLAETLRRDGIDAVIDQYEPFPQYGWRGFMAECQRADQVLVVCTEDYKRQTEIDSGPDAGRGVRWEWEIIARELYDNKLRNTRFIPVLPPGGRRAHIPGPLSDYTAFALENDDQYLALYRILMNQPEITPGALGKPLELPTTKAAPLFPESRETERKGESPRAVNPYPGLRAFAAEMRAYFCGRENEIQTLSGRLRERQLLCVIGASGTGKSSLVAAGLIAALQDETGNMPVLRFTPGNLPARRLAETLDRALPEPRASLDTTPRAERIETELSDDGATALGRHLETLGASRGIIVFIDQFEELFTQSPHGAAEAFRPLFDAMLDWPKLRLALTLRDEFMDRLARWLGGRRFSESMVYLDPLDEAALRRVIETPADRVDVGVPPDLVQAVVSEARDMQGALPLIAYTLHALFEHPQGMTLEAFRALGGLRTAIETQAQQIDAEIGNDPGYARACEHLFAALATVVDDKTLRRTADTGPLRRDRAVSRLVDALAGIGFLAQSERTVAITHEALFTHWPRLVSWLDLHRGNLAQRRQAELAAKEWDRSGRSHPLRWPWERQRPALEALLALSGRDAGSQGSPYTDAGIHAWRTLRDDLAEPLGAFLYPEPLALLDELNEAATSHHRREEIGLRLNQMGDPRRGVGLDEDGLPEIAWVPVAGGSVKLEDIEGEFRVEAFSIARYPVTWRQYRAFLEADDGYDNAAWWEDGLVRDEEHSPLLWSFDNYPAINVSWYDAVAFCRWLSRKHGGKAIRLPTERQWQLAATAGDPDCAYPWGPEWKESCANTAESDINRTVAVGLYPAGDAVFTEGARVADLAGNIWEWCRNTYDTPAGGEPDGDAPRVVRGGSWDNSRGNARAADRNNYDPADRNDYLGFRVCCASPIE
ncbi:MAG: SUMF1/EgtB/PvdO family nonheme iron enzyme [Gammaproteobacteria bacterium]|nr:SUMF1/EgtB/PvdO family nonheme iron enzyme [Gammaproteobacteria bacterium]